MPQVRPDKPVIPAHKVTQEQRVRPEKPGLKVQPETPDKPEPPALQAREPPDKPVRQDKPVPRAPLVLDIRV